MYSIKHNIANYLSKEDRTKFLVSQEQDDSEYDTFSYTFQRHRLMRENTYVTNLFQKESYYDAFSIPINCSFNYNIKKYDAGELNARRLHELTLLSDIMINYMSHFRGVFVKIMNDYASILLQLRILSTTKPYTMCNLLYDPILSDYPTLSFKYIVDKNVFTTVIGFNSHGNYTYDIKLDIYDYTMGYTLFRYDSIITNPDMLRTLDKDMWKFVTNFVNYYFKFQDILPNTGKKILANYMAGTMALLNDNNMVEQEYELTDANLQLISSTSP